MTVEQIFITYNTSNQDQCLKAGDINLGSDRRDGLDFLRLLTLSLVLNCKMEMQMNSLLEMGVEIQSWRRVCEIQSWKRVLQMPTHADYFLTISWWPLLLHLSWPDKRDQDENRMQMQGSQKHIMGFTKYESMSQSQISHKIVNHFKTQGNKKKVTQVRF